MSQAHRKPPVPSEAEIRAAYSVLQSEVSGRAKIEIPVLEWIRFAHASRFDPRLGELWLLAFDRHWQKLSPVAIRDENQHQAIPAVLGVLLDQYLKFLCPAEERKVFRHWSAIALMGVERARFEGFFIGVAPLAGRSVRLDAERPLQVYKKWGFFGRDVLVNKFQEKQMQLQRTALAPAERARALEELLQSRTRITVASYVEACGGLISRRTAQLDLEKRTDLRPEGNTRGRVYRVNSG